MINFPASREGQGRHSLLALPGVRAVGADIWVPAPIGRGIGQPSTYAASRRVLANLDTACALAFPGRIRWDPLADRYPETCRPDALPGLNSGVGMATPTPGPLAKGCPAHGRDACAAAVAPALAPGHPSWAYATWRVSGRGPTPSLPPEPAFSGGLAHHATRRTLAAESAPAPTPNRRQPEAPPCM